MFVALRRFAELWGVLWGFCGEDVRRECARLSAEGANLSDESEKLSEDAEQQFPLEGDGRLRWQHPDRASEPLDFLRGHVGHGRRLANVCS